MRQKPLALWLRAHVGRGAAPVQHCPAPAADYHFVCPRKQLFEFPARRRSQVITAPDGHAPALKRTQSTRPAQVTSDQLVAAATDEADRHR